MKKIGQIENPITVDWVMEYPREAIEIVRFTVNSGSSYRGNQERWYIELFGF